MSTSLTEAPRGPADVAPPAYDYGGGLDVKDLLAILRRRRWVIMGTVLIITTLAVLMGLQVTPKYTAKSLVMIDPRKSKVVDVEAVLQGLGTDAATVETQIKVLKSRDHVEHVMDSLRLFEDPEFNPKLRHADRQVALRVGGPVERLVSWMPDSWLIATGLADEPMTTLESVEPILVREAAIDAFDGRFKVTQEGRSYVIGLAFTSTDPNKAARVVNQAAKLYVEAQKEEKLQATLKASGFLGDRLESMRRETEQAEAAVERFRRRNNLIDMRSGSLKEQEVSDISRALIVARTELAQKQARLKLMRDLRTRGEAVDSMGEVLSSPVIINLRAQEAMLLKEESELRSTLGDKHPKMLNLLNEKETLQKKITAEVDRVIKNLDNDVRAESARVSALEREMLGLTTQNSAQRELDVQLRELERQAAVSRQIYESFLQRHRETTEQQGIVEADSRVISVAAPPNSPSTPGPTLFGAVGFTASVMLGTLLALLLERLDSGLRGARQIEQELGLPALGLVPHLDKLKRGQKPHQYLMAKPLSAYAEAIRAIYTSMQLSDVDNPPKVVLVTSSLPQEGKTTLSVSLATFAARSAQRVLLMDLDLRHPSINREIGTAPPTGFVEHMSGEKALEEVIFKDEETGLHYLPVKRQTANPTDLLGSQKMRQLIALLRERYDFIVMDSAPLMGVTDSKVASLVADKVLFAVRWEKTNADTARNALLHLHEAKASIAGVVLLQVNVKKHAQYGYGDVGQYYGKYQKYYVN